MLRWNSAWVRWRLVELAIALTVLSTAIFIVDNIQQRARNAVPAENWFRVNNIFVPDFAQGDDPTMTYDRTILSEFQGFWVIEIQRLDPETGAFSPECSGSGISDYEPADYIPAGLVKLQWFMGKPCPNLFVGKYRLRGSWSLRKPGWPEKTTVAYSNVFEVLPRP